MTRLRLNSSAARLKKEEDYLEILQSDSQSGPGGKQRKIQTSLQLNWGDTNSISNRGHRQWQTHVHTDYPSCDGKRGRMRSNIIRNRHRVVSYHSQLRTFYFGTLTYISDFSVQRRPKLKPRVEHDPVQALNENRIGGKTRPADSPE